LIITKVIIAIIDNLIYIFGFMYRYVYR